MKKALYIFLTLILFSCSNKNPVNPPLYPIDDSLKYKVIYDYDIRSNDFIEYANCGYLILIDFDSNIKYFEKYNGKTLNADISYAISTDYNKSKINIDSLDRIFINNEFTAFPIDVPFDIDTNSTFRMPFTIENMSYKKSNNDKFHKITIYPKPVKGSYTYPNKFEDFYSKFRELLGFID